MRARRASTCFRPMIDVLPSRITPTDFPPLTVPVGPMPCDPPSDTATDSGSPSAPEVGFVTAAPTSTV